MSIGPQVVQPQPTAIVTMEMRTKVHGGIDSTGAAMGERHGIGPGRRSGGIFRGLLVPQGTVGFVRQTRERFGLTGAFALRLEGCRLGWPRLGLGASAGADRGEHQTKTQQSQKHELIVKKVWEY